MMRIAALAGLLVLTVDGGVARAGLDNLLRSYGDTTLRVDEGEPAAPAGVADRLAPYVGDPVELTTVRWPDGTTSYVALDVLVLRPRNDAGHDHWLGKYGGRTAPPGTGRPSFPTVASNGARETIDRGSAAELIARVDPARADLNQAAFWIHQLGYHGEVVVTSERALRLLALWAQMKVEDTRKTAVDLVAVGGAVPRASPLWGQRIDCPCVRPVPGSGGEQLMFDAWVPAEPSCESGYSRRPPPTTDDPDRDLACRGSARADRDAILILHRTVVRRSGNRTFPDWKELPIGPFVVDLEGPFEMPHVAVIPGDLCDTSEERTALLATLDAQRQFEFRDPDGNCYDAYWSETTGQCVEDMSRFGYRLSGREPADHPAAGDVKCEWEYDWSEPRDLWYRGFVLHQWRSDESSLCLLFWEGDEAKKFLWIDNPDDPLALFWFTREATESAAPLALPAALDLETVSIEVQTVDHCDCPLDERARTTTGTEVCDGRDNDCNRLVDDAARDVGLSCGSSIGECEPGTLACAACDPADPGCAGGVGPVCAGGTGPAAAAEECGNLADDDCDGSIDEGVACPDVDGTRWCPGSERPCGTAVGTCTVGARRCEGAAWGACDGVGPEIDGERAHACNGLDEDCNGAADDFIACGCVDGATRPCGLGDVGECALGVQTCSAGAWGGCVGAVLPRQESCDDADNDCDGVVDNGVGTRACAVTCGGAAAPGCEPTAPSEERLGFQACVDGAWESSCTIARGDEVCNQIDDDCDGTVDELAPDQPGATCGVGACQRDNQCACRTCEPGLPELEHCLAFGSPPRSCPSGLSFTCCDGVDNDCDGDTDDADLYCDCQAQGGGG